MLDYGCGWGDISAMVSTRYVSTVGVDVDEERVAFARTQHPSLRFERCRPDGLDFPDSSFDTVLSVVVIPFVPSLNAYLAECARVLRPGGHLIILFPNPHSWLEWIYLRAHRAPRYSTNLPSLQYVISALHEHGLEVEASGGFFDPPFDRITNPVEAGLSALNVFGHLLQMTPRASYLGYRCRSTRA
jgi:ubiquinone/menaquinone biosynthesis C-methylase UbiE